MSVLSGQSLLLAVVLLLLSQAYNNHSIFSVMSSCLCSKLLHNQFCKKDIHLEKHCLDMESFLECDYSWSDVNRARFLGVAGEQ